MVDLEIGAESGAVFSPEQRQQPPPGLLQDPAAVWLQALHSRRYLETHEKGLCWFAAGSAAGSLPDATGAAAGPGGAAPPGRLELGVCTVAPAAAVTIAATVAITAAAVVTATAAFAAETSAAAAAAESQMSLRATRELGSYSPGPEDGDVQRGRARGETARSHGDQEHGLLSFMAAREGIGHVRFHQSEPHQNPPIPTRPASELSTPK